MPNAQPILQGSVPSKPPSERVVLKPPGGNGLPKYELRSVPNPSVNSAEWNNIPNASVNNVVRKQIPNQHANNGVQNSGIKNGVNSAQDQNIQNKAQDQKVQNNVNNTVNTNQEKKGSEVSKVNSIPIVSSVPSSSNVPKLEIREEIKNVIKKEKLSEPKIPTGNGNNNKAISKVLSPKAPCLKPSIQENNILRRSNRVSKPCCGIHHQ